MKKFINENLVIIIIVAVVVTLITVSGLLIVNGMKKQQAEIEKQVKYVDEKYKEFSIDTSSVSEKRTKIYGEIFNNVYYVDFKTKDESWKQLFSEYYDLIDKIHNDYKEVIDICKKYNFIYDATKQKCESFNTYYELFINNYATDYNLYNSNIDKYNKWTESNTSYERLEKLVIEKYTEYQDYNGNGETEYYNKQ